MVNHLTTKNRLLVAMLAFILPFAFVKAEVKEDGKMNVTDRQKAYLQINEDAENVLEVINEFAGVLPFDDKASPEVIQREFGLSKGAFKRAIGHLMKEGKVEIKDKRIYAK